VESEEGHRVAYNIAFRDQSVDVEWSTDFYGWLQNSIGGGKEKMTWFFNTHGWPEPYAKASPDDRKAFIDYLQDIKTETYVSLVEHEFLPIRPGIRRFINEAHALGIPMAVCSAASKDAVRGVLDNVLGKEYVDKFEFVLAGTDVKKKKPHPDIYLAAAERLGVSPSECLVIEDSRIGLQAAKAAGMKCVITYTHYTFDQDFTEADAVYPELGDDPKTALRVATFFR